MLENILWAVTNFISGSQSLAKKLIVDYRFVDLIANSIKIANEIPEAYFRVLEFFLQDTGKMFEDEWVPLYNNFFLTVGDYVEGIMSPELRVSLVRVN